MIIIQHATERACICDPCFSGRIGKQLRFRGRQGCYLDPGAKSFGEAIGSMEDKEKPGILSIGCTECSEQNNHLLLVPMLVWIVET